MRSLVRFPSVSLFHCNFLYLIQAKSTVPGNDAHAEERRRYTEEIETLREKAATAEGLAAENIALKAELHSTNAQCTTRPVFDLEDGLEQPEGRRAANFCGLEGSTVSIEEYDNLKQELVESNRDYEKLLFAHSILRSKIQKHKDTIRQWRAYVNEWVLRHPGRKPKPPSQNDLEPAQSMDPHGHSALSPPTPPAMPEGTTPSVDSLSRSTSPQQQGCRTSKYTGNGLENLLVPQSGAFKASTDEIRATQTVLKHDPHVESDDLTQSSGESEEASESLGKLRSQDWRSDEKTLPPPPTTQDASSPIIVSERSLKRKRLTRDTGEGIDNHGRGRNASNAPKSPHVKDEITSSSPLPIDPICRLREPNDSIDLDDVGDQLTTPRKRQRMELQQLKSSIMALPAVVEKEETLFDTAEGFGPVETRLVDIEDEDDYQASHENVSFARESAMDDRIIRDHENDQGPIRKAEKKALLRAHNDRVVGRRESAERSPSGSTLSGANSRNLTENVCTPGSPSLRGLPPPASDGRTRPLTPQGLQENEQREAEIANTIILRPTDTNTHILPRTSDGLATYRQLCPPSRRDRGAAAIPALAEDGEDPGISSKRSRPDQGTKKEPKASDAHHRLGALLSEHPTAKAVPPLPLPKERDTPKAATFSKTPLSRMEQQHRAPATPATLPSKKRTALATMTSMNPPMTEGSKSSSTLNKMPFVKPMFRKPSTSENPPDVLPEQKPLRARPLHRLRLEDFKLNPTHSDFAYHDSIRKHDEKKALSGCTKPHCPRCKDLRKFVESSGYANLSLQNNNHNDKIDDDEKLILDSLGGDTQRAKNLSEKERKEILNEARLRQFADRFGKHRTLFGRAKSPVGFWDVGFPSTQEEERNREKARGRGREMVEERYWAAMRKGGMWVFADD